MRCDEGEEFWQKLECGKCNCGIHDGLLMLFEIGFSQLRPERVLNPDYMIRCGVCLWEILQMTTLTSFGKLCLHHPNVFREEVIMK